jgi:hypothetical protein
MRSTKKRKGKKSTALALKRKKPTKAQKDVMRGILSKQPKILKDAAAAAAHGLVGPLIPKKLLKHLPHLKLPKLPHIKLPHIKLDPGKLGREMSHDIHKATHFFTGWLKALTFPHYKDKTWNCPPKGKHWDGKEIKEPKIKRPHIKMPRGHIKALHNMGGAFKSSHKKLRHGMTSAVRGTSSALTSRPTSTLAVTQKGGRRTRRYIRRKRRTRRKHCTHYKRRTRRRKRRKRRRRRTRRR